MAENYDFIVFDLDGTLVTKHFEIEEGSLAAFAKIQNELGLRATIATGRSYSSAKPYLDQLGIVEPMVFSNGSVLDNPDSGLREVVAGIPLESALMALMLKQTLPSVSIKVHLADGQIFKTDETVWPEEGTHFVTGTVDTELIKNLDEDPIKMVLYGPNPAEVDEFAKRLSKALGKKPTARLFRSHKHYVEMTNATVSKGAAMLLVMEKLGIEPSRVIAVGDQENDYELLEIFGLAVRVGDHCPRLEEVADLRINPPDKGGIEDLFRILKERN